MRWDTWSEQTQFEVLVGKTINAIERLKNELRFITSDGLAYRMYHAQSCCEGVTLEDVAGDLEDLIGSPILLAEKVSSDEPTPEVIEERKAEYAQSVAASTGWAEWMPRPETGWKPDDGAELWTFYKLATIKGAVTLRWYGSSNGYYSVGVNFEEVKPGDIL